MTKKEITKEFGAKEPVMPINPFTPHTFKNIKKDRLKGIDEYTDGLWFNELSNIEGVYLAGGALRNLLGGGDVIADIDLFFRDIVALKKAISIMSELETWYEAFRCPANELITYKTVIDKPDEEKTPKDFNNQGKIQFITKSFYPSISDLINSFDFVPTCAGMYEGILYTHPDWVKSVKKRTLSLNFVSFPVASIFRMMKYKEKGYCIPSSTVVDMVMEISDGEFDGDRMALYVD